MALPPIFLILFRDSPALDLSKSMKNRDRPSEGFFTSSRGVVRARRTIFVATCALDIQIFWPEIR